MINPNDACEVAPRVFFGPARTTFDSKVLQQFTHIVNCDTYRSTSSTAAQLKKYLFLPSTDDEFPILDTYLKILYEWIEEALEDPEAKVFIHCYMGWNRSACLAIAYGCKKGMLRAEELIREVRSRLNHDILTNEDFEADLLQRFQKIESKSTYFETQ